MTWLNGRVIGRYGHQVDPLSHLLGYFDAIIMIQTLE